MELADQEVQGGEVQSILNFWVKQLSCVINRTTRRSRYFSRSGFFGGIGRVVNASSGDALTSMQD